jgi:hypothetical protein
VALPTGTAAGAQASFTFSGVDAFRQAGNTLTLIFLASAQSNNTPSLTFASSEAANPSAAPVLTVVPEPTTGGALVVAALGLLARRRRARWQRSRPHTVSF